MEAGTEIAGRYRLEHVLGGGAFGEVWRAVDLLRDRPVAVKVLHREVAATGPVWLSKFRQEARIAVRLEHPCITTVDDFGEYGGQWYLVMEFLDGVSLDQEIAKYPEGLELSRVLALGAQIASGLAAAYEHGIVHRDLKPSNIMLIDGDRIKICDFGIAHIADASATHTLSGQAAGTPGFMAPEQWVGDSVDHRTDLYAFGGILYAALTGKPPFPGPSVPALMGQHLNIAPTPPSQSRRDVPAPLEQLVLGLLAKDPGQRPGAAADVLRDLESIMGASAHSWGTPIVRSVGSAGMGAAAQIPPASGEAGGFKSAGRRGVRLPLVLSGAALAAVAAVGVSLALVLDSADKSEGPGAGASGQAGVSTEKAKIENGPVATEAGGGEEPGQAVSGSILDFGSTFTFPDGLRLTIGKPKRITPSAHAAIPVKTEHYVSFKITVTNRSPDAYAPSDLYATLQSANQEMEQVFDSGASGDARLSGNPDTPLLPGREVTWNIGFGAKDPDDLIMQVTVRQGRDPLIFKS